MQTWIRFRHPDGDAAGGRLDEGDADRVIECDGLAIPILAPRAKLQLRLAGPAGPVPAGQDRGAVEQLSRPRGPAGESGARASAVPAEAGKFAGRPRRRHPASERVYRQDRLRRRTPASSLAANAGMCRSPRAASHIFGYTIVNDVTASEAAQCSIPTSAVDARQGFRHLRLRIGPAIVSGFDWRSASVVAKARLDGVERQELPVVRTLFFRLRSSRLLSRT